MISKRNIGCLMLILASIIWGIGFSIQSLASEHVSSFTFFFFKSLGSLFLIPLAIKMRRKLDKNTIIGGIVCGIFMMLGGIFQQLGIENSTVSKASFITTLYIVFVPIIGIFIGRKVLPHVWIGVFIATIGLFLLCMKEKFSLAIGDIYLLLGALSYAFQIYAIDKYVKIADPIIISIIAGIFSSIICGVIMVLIEKPLVSDIISVWPYLFYCAVMSYACGQTIQIVYQKYVEPNLASLLMSLESVFGAIGGVFILNQILSLREGIGCLLIFISLIIAQKK